MGLAVVEPRLARGSINVAVQQPISKVLIPCLLWAMMVNLLRCSHPLNSTQGCAAVPVSACHEVPATRGRVAVARTRLH